MRCVRPMNVWLRPPYVELWGGTTERRETWPQGVAGAFGTTPSKLPALFAGERVSEEFADDNGDSVHDILVMNQGSDTVNLRTGRGGTGAALIEGFNVRIFATGMAPIPAFGGRPGIVAPAH